MEITDYIHGFITSDNKQLGVIDRQYETRQNLVPHIGPEVGKILGLVIRAMGARRLIEFGTCIGYSTIWLGEAAKATGGRLIAVEASELYFNEARNNVADAGLSEYVELIMGMRRRLLTGLKAHLILYFRIRRNRSIRTCLRNAWGSFELGESSLRMTVCFCHWVSRRRTHRRCMNTIRWRSPTKGFIQRCCR